MKENIVAKLTPKDDKYACSFADKIISESQETDEWYEYFDDFASLLSHPKSFVRNQALYILASCNRRKIDYSQTVHKVSCTGRRCNTTLYFKNIVLFVRR